ncbi:SDR family oxidoreductase [Thalassotalea sp. M1531]|uniref:SDR family oxidoreductase n=1 Tax=Thalassotalea algicola TaxID=2716224 RepID=A0A7Y0L9N6_9GAMM|nr:SDR family oxidoreductase [Thalassotalea algicola]NMP30337.1 SDR family oxidoreductase [Thalassotalea algicola]
MQKYIIVTGGASGLGLALAKRWAKAGAFVCIADINDEAANIALSELQTINNECFYQHCDVTKLKDIQQLKQTALDKWPQVDMIVNNAGVATADRIEDESISQWQWVLEINLLAAVKVSQVFTPLFKLQQQGYFLNVASQAGITPIPYMASYNASKAAMVSLSETLRLELADDNICVSVLCPGFFKTNLGDSLKTKLTNMKSMLGRVFESAEITSEQVAEQAYQAVTKRKFMILTHSEGKKVFRFKQWLPIHWYLAMVLKQTAKLRARVGKE